MDLFLFALALAAGSLALYVIICGLASKQWRCWWKTQHMDREALGSVLRDDGPHFAYRCKRCGGYYTEPWE